MSLVRLNIKGISYSQTQSGAYALVLSEVKGSRTLPIVIGAFEAQSIAIALEKEIKPPRPLTHDLFKSFADRFHIIIKQVIIHKLVDGVFYSSLICERDKIEEIIDARTSDAIALALRFDAQIFTYKNILDKAGIYLKVNPNKDDEKQFSLDEVKYISRKLLLSINELHNNGVLHTDIKLDNLLTNYFDTNNINFNKLPKVDLYASSFAGGASGFPLMFENYSIEQKKNIIDKYLEYNPNNISDLCKKINTEKSNFILGSRFLDNSKIQIYIRTFYANKILSRLFSFIYRVKITDIATCYKMMPSDYLKNTNFIERHPGIMDGIKLLSLNMVKLAVHLVDPVMGKGEKEKPPE